VRGITVEGNTVICGLATLQGFGNAVSQPVELVVMMTPQPMCEHCTARS
jgi:hypothetical protein